LDDHDIFEKKKNTKKMKNNNLYFIDINFWTKFSLYLHKSYIKGIIATCKSDRIVKIENVIDICEDKL
jgi:hypothetical protein